MKKTSNAPSSFLFKAMLFALLGLGLPFSALAEGWVRPTGHYSPEGQKWSAPELAYDLSTESRAADRSNRIGYGAWVEFHLAVATPSNRAKVLAESGYGVVDAVQLEVWPENGAAWVPVFDDAIQNMASSEIQYPRQTIEKIRFRYHYIKAGYYFFLFDCQVYQCAPDQNDDGEIPGWRYGYKYPNEPVEEAKWLSQYAPQISVVQARTSTTSWWKFAGVSLSHEDGAPFPLYLWTLDKNGTEGYPPDLFAGATDAMAWDGSLFDFWYSQAGNRVFLLLVQTTHGTGRVTPKLFSCAAGTTQSYDSQTLATFNQIHVGAMATQPLRLEYDGDRVRALVGDTPLVAATTDSAGWVVYTGDENSYRVTAPLGQTRFWATLAGGYMPGEREMILADAPLVTPLIAAGPHSAVNPAWVDGPLQSNAERVEYRIDGGAVQLGVRENLTRWHADNAFDPQAGMPRGLMLSANASTRIEVTSYDAAGNVLGQQTREISWTPMDLTGSYGSRDEIRIRAGDSLLLTGSSATGALLEIDADGDGVVDHAGIPGETFPTRYQTPGTYLAEAKIDHLSVGALTVHVISTDLHGPVAALHKKNRSLEVYVTPSANTNDILFIAQDPSALTLSVSALTEVGATLNLNARVKGESRLVGRLSSAFGPIVDEITVHAFSMKSLNGSMIMVKQGGDSYYHGELAIEISPPTIIDNDNLVTPAQEGLFFDVATHSSHLVFAENGQTTLRVHCTRQDANGIIRLPIVQDGSAYNGCHKVRAVQVNSPEWTSEYFGLSNPKLAVVGCGIYTMEVVRPNHSIADRRLENDRNGNSKRDVPTMHGEAGDEVELKNGTYLSDLHTQIRNLAITSTGTGVYSIFISEPPFDVIPFDAMHRAESENCPGICGSNDDVGLPTFRSVGINPRNPTAEVNPEIYYPVQPEQILGDNNPEHAPWNVPFGTHIWQKPNFVKFNPGPLPTEDFPSCGEVPCPNEITAADRCGSGTAPGCKKFSIHYLNHFGKYDLHYRGDAQCPTVLDPKVSGFEIYRAECAGGPEMDAISGADVPEPHGAVFPDLVPLVNLDHKVRIKILEGGERETPLDVEDPSALMHPTRIIKTTKGVIEKGTNRFKFEASQNPEFVLPPGAVVTYLWEFGDGTTGVGPVVEHTYLIPGRYIVKLVMQILNIEPPLAEFPKAELHDISIIRKVCDPDRPQGPYVAGEKREGVPVRAIFCGNPGSTYSACVFVRRHKGSGDKGKGAISLDGYNQAEYEHPWEEAAVHLTETPAHYFSVTIDGMAHGPDGAVGGLPPYMTTVIVYVQGLATQDVYNNLEWILMGRNQDSKCECPSGCTEPGKACNCYYLPTDYEPFNVAKLEWHEKEHNVVYVGRTSRLAHLNPPLQVVKPYHLRVLCPSDYEGKVVVSHMRAGQSLQTREYDFRMNKLVDSSGAEPQFVFVDNPAGNMYDTDIPNFGSAVIVESNQGDCLQATLKDYPEFVSKLWVFDPHEPGDYSADAMGKDVEKTGGEWVTTKYYYSVDAQYVAYPLTADDPQVEFHKDVNYLWGINLAGNGSKLDMEFSGQTAFNVGVDRFIQAGGVIVQKHIDNGIISDKVRIRVCATGNITATLNGIDASLTRGSFASDVPEVGELTVAATALKTAFDKGANGGRPTPASNTLQFNGQQCMIHWIELSFDAMSPYVLVHGKGADGTFWDARAPGKSTTCWPPFNDLLRSKEIPFDSSISLKGTLSDPSQDTVINQSVDFQLQIIPVAASFGVRHINLIAHSKGGLDSRYWLTELNQNPIRNGVKLIVGQYITICTPHRGSVVADLVVVGEFVSVFDIESNLISGGRIPFDVSGFLQTFQALDAAADLVGAPNDTPATYCLRTNRITDDRRAAPAQDDCATYGAVYGMNLPTYRNVDSTAPTFWAVRADADRDNSKHIDMYEADEAAKYGGFAAYLGQLTYSALGRVQTISQPPGATFPIGWTTAKLIQTSEYPLGLFQPNDLLVTYDSAIYPPFNQTLSDIITHYDHGGITRTSIANQLYVRSEVMTPRK